jgi:hypothetical protein
MNAPIEKLLSHAFDVSETKERLENWRQWARPRMQQRVTQSLEGRYRPPPSWHPPEAKTEVNLIDALKVERAIVNLAPQYKQVIIYSYIYPYLDLRAFCRKAKINIRDFESMQRKAVDMVHNLLLRAGN